MSFLIHVSVVVLLLCMAASIGLLVTYYGNMDNNQNDKVKTFGDNQEGTLLMVHVMIRHGDRTPDFTYPMDIYKNETYFPFGPGGLTFIGKQRANNVGKELRKRYNSFLGPEYYPAAVSALSSALPRCKLSLQELLASLFPLQGDACNNWQSVDYEYIPADQDHMITTYITCPSIWDAKLTDPSHNCEDLELVQRILRENTGWPVESPKELYQIRDTLQTQEEYGFPLPDWVKSIWKSLVNCSPSILTAIVGDKKILSYAVGNLFRKIIEDSYMKLNGSHAFKELKISIYSGHDMNVAGLLGAMDVYFGQAIAYSEYLIFELHNIGNTAGFKIYQRNYKTGLHLLDVPNCGTFCPLDKLHELIQPLFPSVWCK